MSDEHFRKIHHSLGRIEGNIESLKEGVKRINGTNTEHDKRIRKNSTKIAHQTGKVIGLGASASALIAVIWELIRR